MPLYRFYEFGKDGSCTRYTDRECADDDAAIAHANRLPNKFGLEVWLHDGPRIHRIEPANPPDKP